MCDIQSTGEPLKPEEPSSVQTTAPAGRRIMGRRSALLKPSTKVEAAEMSAAEMSAAEMSRGRQHVGGRQDVGGRQHFGEEQEWPEPDPATGENGGLALRWRGEGLAERSDEVHARAGRELGKEPGRPSASLLPGNFSPFHSLLYVAFYRGVTTSAGCKGMIARIATLVRRVQKAHEGVALDHSGSGQYYRLP